MSKAWVVSYESYDDYSTVVFAETSGQAKALGAAELDAPFVDVRASRAAWADNIKSRGAYIDWEDTENIKVLRERGWWLDDGSFRNYFEGCRECGLKQFALLPLSVLDEKKVCGYCREKEATSGRSE